MAKNHKALRVRRSTSGRSERQNSCWRTLGFTLIELLVVISILSILLTLLFPAFQEARNSTEDVVCLSNMKSIGLAGQSYLTDHGEWIYPAWISNNINAHPYDANWRWVYYWNYLNEDKDVFRCPRVRRGVNFNIRGGDHEQWVDRNAPHVSVYGINVMWNRWKNFNPDTWVGWSKVKFSQIMEPSKTVAFSGGMNGGWSIQGEYPPGHIVMSVPGDTGWIDFTRHDNRAPIAFADGHARYVEHEKLFNVNAQGPERWHNFLAWY
jgi:prepilin-type N-terminal cleavage/methylation domain-containing protein/prepilin-type processing-associated H-X9-DG protein